jgi:hypothetical protein
MLVAVDKSHALKNPHDHGVEYLAYPFRLLAASVIAAAQPIKEHYLGRSKCAQGCPVPF